MSNTDTNLDVLSEQLLTSVRNAQREFLCTLDPLRPELHRYCRRLTGDVWDAEDLVQETLTRAFARAAESHQPVERPIAWLVRIATNAFLDWTRRPAPTPAELPERHAPAASDPAEVRDALSAVSMLLPPQERAAVVLKDVFDLPNAEIAAIIGTTVGAVKAALHRGRGRLLEAGDGATQPRRPAPDRAVVDALADAFTSYDIERLAGLFLADGVSEVVGMVHEVGRDRVRAGSLHHTLVIESDVRYRADVRELDAEDVVLLWATPVDGSEPAAVADALRVETADGAVARLRWYYFCPETLTELGERLDVPVRPAGYHL